MRKSTKYIGGAGIMAGLAYFLFNTHSAKASAEKIKTSFTESRQLFNRLIEQLKATKQNSVNLKSALQAMDLTPLKAHLDNFNRHLQPELKKIKATGQKMNRHHDN